MHLASHSAVMLITLGTLMVVLGLFGGPHVAVIGLGLVVLIAAGLLGRTWTTRP